MIRNNISFNYLDPGTGAFIFQVAAAAFVSLGIYFKSIKDFIKVKFFKKDKPN